MKASARRPVLFAVFFAFASATFPLTTEGQPAQNPPREFPIGALKGVEELPAGRLRSRIEGLPVTAQDRAVQWLRSFHFTEADVPSLRADGEGGIFYACSPAQTSPVAAEAPVASQAAVPVSPFPAGLVFHSKPGAPNVIYLNFMGETVSGTVWNTEISRTSIPAVAFSFDSDLTTFSDAEQTAIKRIWLRVAEDYSPFNVDVTTERPATLGTRVAMALITRTTDANGAANPYSDSGGVAYVNVFGTTGYASYRPAWIYHNNLANSESYIAEAAAHEVGHNMGLSHDGKTDGTEYYGGHGSGDISWGPIMGTGYDRNVSQWSKGEYYLANNTQDDLAIIAGKLTYRTDDHGATPGTAAPLVVTGGTNIVSTTPDNDPTNTSPANKGILERNTDVDVFSFVTGAGPISLKVNPFLMPSGTRGGDADLSVELRDEAGVLLLTNNPATQTIALIETNLVEGRYYLYVRNSGAGDPLSSTPTGYTSYGSIGQYFISGYLTDAAGFVAPPLAEFQAADLTQTGQSVASFSVTYSDDVAIAASTLDGNDLLVTGPNGYSRPATLASVNTTGDGTPRVATYTVTAPGAVWLPADNGLYTVWMQTNEVGNTRGAFVPAGQLGQLHVAVPVAIYAVSMDSDPGWTFEGQWQYGAPAYASGGPTSGATGAKIVGYNLSGKYARSLTVKYATTQAINVSGASSLTLRFMRWLRVQRGDTASLQVSTNGTAWITVWANSGSVLDTAWQAVQYSLPAAVAGSPTLRVRWGMASNPDGTTELGWNLDDVQVLGDGTVDTAPPVAKLSVANLTLAGSPTHACSVTYTDATAVRLASLDSTDLVVTGPNGYSNTVEFVGADLPVDGTPITATYSIPSPGGMWDAADNGTYTITLTEDAVTDTLNNPTPGMVLGTFEVALPATNPGVLTVLPGGNLVSSGTAGGPFTPTSIDYTLTNAGGAALDWAASAAEDWVGLSATNGTLAAGASITVTVSLATPANALIEGVHASAISFRDVAASTALLRTVELTVHPLPISLAARLTPAAGFQILLTGQPLRSYVIETTSDFTAWTSVGTNTAQADGRWSYSDLQAMETTPKFYRARLLP